MEVPNGCSKVQEGESVMDLGMVYINNNESSSSMEEFNISR